jgi:hypothetical protein
MHFCARKQTGSAGTTGIPRAMVLRLIRGLLGVPGFLAAVARKSSPRELDSSVGEPGPHDFAVRVGRARLRCRQRPSHPAPNVRDDREAPLWIGGGTDQDNHEFPKNGRGIFLREGLDTILIKRSDLPDDEAMQS